MTALKPKQPEPTAAQNAVDFWQRISRWFWLGGGMGLILLLVACQAQGAESPRPAATTRVAPAANLTDPPRSATETPTNTSQPATDTVTSAPTDTATPIPTITPSLTPEELPPLITDDYGVPMALVPAGSFQMGSDADDALAECQRLRDGCQRAWFEDEEPVHTVTLDDFYIDQYEVTNARYAECIAAGVCDPPSENGSHTRESYFGDSGYADYPVIYINWETAQTYCQWRDARLPTEAEWEKAARSGLEGAQYPWGNEAPVCEKGASNGANFDDNGACGEDTEPVGSYSANGYGLYDMAGNVWEWTADWYDSEYYAVSPENNPTGPEDGGFRVMRGGSWLLNIVLLRVAWRERFNMYHTYSYVGVRCARDVSRPETSQPAPNVQATRIPTVTSTMDGFGVPMALVPAGSFQMGSEDGKDIEKPVHTVTLDDFYIDQYEVTNAHYAECVGAGVCDPPSQTASYTRESYYGEAEYADYPVIYVNWKAAQTYCQWRDARLPTEAEWEKAARGGLEGAQYPWGDEFDGTLVNYCDTNCYRSWKDEDFDDGFDDTAPVGRYPPNGYGLYDIGGNVSEWVADWYDSEYYANSPESNPTGPKNGEYRVLRGGGWNHNSYFLRVANRAISNPYSSYFVGFRCVGSVAPP
jgi:formylglycine-generating enzyme required for sulfatase activity